MFTVIFLMLVIVGFSWVAMKFVYPKPPQGYYKPKPDESTEPRQCDYCHHTLAEWRGIVDGEQFFCNQEHQAEFLAGKTYQPHE